jgi:hypothetical protein
MEHIPQSFFWGVTPSRHNKPMDIFLQDPTVDILVFIYCVRFVNLTEQRAPPSSILNLPDIPLWKDLAQIRSNVINFNIGTLFPWIAFKFTLNA